METAPIRRGRASPSRLTDDPADIGGIRFPSAMHTGAITVAEMLERTQTNGFLVLHRDKVVHESHHGLTRPGARHLGQSISKAIVSAAAGTLIGEGRLDPNALVTDYLPELATTAWRGARVTQVMDMTTGVRFTEDYDDPLSDMARLDVAAGWRAPPEGAKPSDWPRTIWELLLNLRTAERPHGEAHSYRSVEADVLGLILARIEGEPLEDVISHRIWAPMGAEADASITVDAEGVALADAGISASLRDYARFGRLFLEGGMADGRRVLPDSWVSRVMRGDGGAFDDIGREQFPNGSFRSMFWIEDRTRQTLVSQGTFGQLLYIAPELDLVGVKMSSWAQPLDNAMTAEAIRAFHAIAEALA